MAEIAQGEPKVLYEKDRRGTISVQKATQRGTYLAIKKSIKKWKAGSYQNLIGLTK
ncbi:MAG TPA: hypothetical protein VJ279_01280 [Hanamia sp.]|nr:hypothetical protein [Hanamia sp.]